MSALNVLGFDDNFLFCGNFFGLVIKKTIPGYFSYTNDPKVIQPPKGTPKPVNCCSNCGKYLEGQKVFFHTRFSNIIGECCKNSIPN